MAENACGAFNGTSRDTSKFAQTHDGAWRGKPQSSDSESAIQLQSLRLANDPQYKEMRRYSNSGAAHFERLLNGQGNDKSQVVTCLDPDAVETASIEGRAQWQNSFDKTVKKLMVDFDLSNEPTARLNHLRRMHDWFVTHGGKQQRKERAPPHHIRLGKNEPLPPGSARHCGRAGSSAAHLSMAGNMAMNRTSAAVEQALERRKASAASLSARY